MKIGRETVVIRESTTDRDSESKESAANCRISAGDQRYQAKEKKRGKRDNQRNVRQKSMIGSDWIDLRNEDFEGRIRNSHELMSSWVGDENWRKDFKKNDLSSKYVIKKLI